MIESIQLLRNFGQFDSVTPPQDTALTPFTLLYAENGRGKTTLATMLRSLSANAPELVIERHRLGAQHPPHIVLTHGGAQITFQNGAWSRALPEIAIFDDAFVAANVCSGIEVQAAHRKNLHELILGAEGVALSNNLQGHIDRIEAHNVHLRDLSDAIPAAARGPYNVDAFCNLEQVPNINAQIEEAQRRLAAARSADAIRQRTGFQEVSLPDFDIPTIDAVLEQTLADLEAAAAERVRNHLISIGEEGEAWVAEGMPRIADASQGKEYEACPFCSQDLRGSDLIAHYRAYFSEEYETLKATIRQAGIAVRDAHAGDIPAAFERSIRTSVQTHEFWKDFVEIPEIEIDTAAIARDWNAAKEAVLTQLRAKAAAPLEQMALSPQTRQAIQTYRVRITEVAELSTRLTATNERLDLVREQAAADDLAALSDDLARLLARKARFEPNVAQSCDVYMAEKAAKAATENLRNQARAALDQYRDQIFPAYEDAINAYLTRFAASFRLGQVQSVNQRGGSSASYCVVINNENVEVGAEEGPSFRNTLSAGDRNALALAFFFASLEQDGNLANKIVAIDDPMTSLDEHRMLHTRAQIIALSRMVQQMIVLSHSKPFLCDLWDQADRNARTALRISRAAAGSEIAVWDVRNDSISEHDKRHERVRGYLQAANPDDERMVAQALRPILEKFLRVAYPEHFFPGQLIGPFLGVCEQRVGGPNEIISQADIDELRTLKDYANRFHHDSNQAWETEHINDIELSDFAGRTLLFSSRR